MIKYLEGGSKYSHQSEAFIVVFKEEDYMC